MGYLQQLLEVGGLGDPVTSFLHYQFGFFDDCRLSPGISGRGHHIFQQSKQSDHNPGTVGCLLSDMTAHQVEVALEARYRDHHPGIAVGVHPGVQGAQTADGDSA